MGQIVRRRFLVGVGALLAVTLANGAEPGAKLRRVGLLVNLPPPPDPVAVGFLNAVRLGLRDAGFVEEKNLAIEARWVPNIKDLPRVAKDLVNSDVDVLLTFTTPATRAATVASTKIPIVFTMVSDPVGSGFVDSLAHPGRNITGVTNVFPEASEKLLYLMREAVPNMHRAAVLWNPDNRGKALDFKFVENAARAADIELKSYGVRAAGGFTAAFSRIARDRPDVLIILVETLTYLHRKEIADFGIAQRLPTGFNLGHHVEVGGLMSFSPDTLAIHRRAGALAGKVLKGMPPADVPVERPTTFHFAINLKTAQAVGLSIPQSLVLRADQIIE